MRRKRKQVESITPTVLAYLKAAHAAGRAAQRGSTYVDTCGRLFRRKIVEHGIQLNYMNQLQKLQLLTLVKENKVKIVYNHAYFEKRCKQLYACGWYVIRYRTEIELGNINTKEVE